MKKPKNIMVNRNYDCAEEFGKFEFEVVFHKVLDFFINLYINLKEKINLKKWKSCK